jgi:hypothetical protein
VPPSAAVVGATFPEPDDEPLPEELCVPEPLEPVSLDGAEAPPFPEFDVFAGASFLGALLPPVAVGRASSY